jgi:hypothetical protein
MGAIAEAGRLVTEHRWGTWIGDWVALAIVAAIVLAITFPGGTRRL